MKNRYPIIVVGDGQAGLSLIYCLKEKNFDYIVFEKNTSAIHGVPDAGTR